MARKPSVEKKIEKISGTCTKELSELQEMLEKPDSVDDASLDAIEGALLEMNTGWKEGFDKCRAALKAKKKTGETDREIGMGGGEDLPKSGRDLDLEDVL